MTRKNRSLLEPGYQAKIWRFCGETGLARRPHRHSELEMNLVEAGWIRYCVSGKTVDLTPGSMFWLFPGQNHILLDRGRDARMWIAIFDQRLTRGLRGISGWRKLISENPGGNWHRRPGHGACGEIAAILDDLATFSAKPVLFNTAAAYLLARAWETFFGAAETATPPEVNRQMLEAIRLISEVDPTLDTDTLARKIGYSRSHLSRLFRAETGLRLVEFRNRIRLDRFLEKYRPGGNRTMLSAALDAGFGSYPSFHRVFAGFFGKSPVEYFSAHVIAPAAK